MPPEGSRSGQRRLDVDVGGFRVSISAQPLSAGGSSVPTNTIKLLEITFVVPLTKFDERVLPSRWVEMRVFVRELRTIRSRSEGAVGWVKTVYG
jgi:hypothetical protein